jgi:ribosomal-protein-alanine N-acetyltransferase
VSLELSFDGCNTRVRRWDVYVSASVLEVRPFATPRDYERMIEYFHGADDALLALMGVDRRRLPAAEAWLARLLPDLALPPDKKQTYYLGWWLDGVPVGHSNVNQIRFAEQAHIHLHLWHAPKRRSGFGQRFFERSLSCCVSQFQLRCVICEPRAENPAPNAVLTRAGFQWIRRYRTVPGLINTEQDVNRWELQVGGARSDS